MDLKFYFIENFTLIISDFVSEFDRDDEVESGIIGDGEIVWWSDRIGFRAGESIDICSCPITDTFGQINFSLEISICVSSFICDWSETIGCSLKGLSNVDKTIINYII